MKTFIGLCVLKLIEAFVLIYDILTFVFYFLYQQPHRIIQISRRVKAKPLVSRDTSSPFRSLEAYYKLKTTPEEGINTLVDVFDIAVSRHAKLPSLGTREVISEEEEMIDGGKMFKKATLGNYTWQSFSTVQNRVMNLHAGLLHINGITKISQVGSKKVCLFAETCAEWIISMFACFNARLPLVTLYASLGEEGVIHGLNETRVETLIISHDLLPTTLKLLPETTHLKTVVCMGGCEHQEVTLEDGRIVKVLPLVEVEEIGKEERSKQDHLVVPKPDKDELAFIMYTSGSTGTPKGVLLSHRNVICAISGQGQRVGNIGPWDVYIGYLPLAHVLEVTAEICSFMRGVPIGFSSPSTLTDNSTRIKPGTKGDISALRPTLMTAVPLIMDRLYKLVWEKVNEGPAFKRNLFAFAYEYKKKNYEAGYDTPLCDRLVFKKIRSVLGGRVRLMLTGGAPLSSDTQRFMNICFCCPIIQGYGLTETCGAGAVSEMTDRNTGRVGAPLQCCDVMLVNWEEGKYYNTDRPFPRGEVWIRGDNVAVGYFKVADDSGEAFHEMNGQNWFATGDIGMIEPDGSLRIIDRKKDLIKLQAGEYIALAKVETQLKLCPLVDNLCVYADSNRMYVVALVVPNMKNLENLAKEMNIVIGWPYICEEPEIIAAVLKSIQAQGVRSKLAKFEIPQKVTMVPDVWTPDTGLVTPAFKLKRKNIELFYLSKILRMYK